MILLIDNYDSFTYNLYQQISRLGGEVQVFANDEISTSEIAKLNPSHIIISPGPQTPSESGISIPTIKKFHQELPILGVCLGHQCIGQIFGAKVVGAKSILHGKTSEIHHTGTHLFQGTETPFTAARYHSLAISHTPEEFIQTAHTDDGEIMAISHKEYQLHGIQFHPESFMTEVGDQIIQNFIQP